MHIIGACIFLSCVLKCVSPIAANSKENPYDEIKNDTMEIKDYESMDNSTTSNKAFESEDAIPPNVTLGFIPSEDADRMDYEIYAATEPEYDLEFEEDGLEMPKDWLYSDSESLNTEESRSLNDFANETREEDLETQKPDDESLDDDEIPQKRKPKSKISGKKRNEDNFHYKRKKHVKKGKSRGKNSQKMDYWKRNCCIRGKKVGNTRRTYLSHNLFQECRDRTRNLSSRMSRSCKWFFWNCCEARALRRYYVHHRANNTTNNC